jgi:hypothetical protein
MVDSILWNCYLGFIKVFKNIVPGERGGGGRFLDASTKRPLPVLVLPFKTSPNDFIPDNHEFQVKITLVLIIPKFRFPEKVSICVKHS